MVIVRGDVYEGIEKSLQKTMAETPAAYAAADFARTKTIVA